jgi:predicted N-acyltransferase
VSEAPYTAHVQPGVAQLSAADWDALTDGANPFVSHAFLSALEDRIAWAMAPVATRAHHDP